MLYSCTHMATVGIRGLKKDKSYTSSMPPNLEFMTSWLAALLASHLSLLAALQHSQQSAHPRSMLTFFTSYNLHVQGDHKLGEKIPRVFQAFPKP